MSSRKIIQQFQSTQVTEGAGVQIYRSLGSPQCRNLDPFLMLDHFSTENPDDYIAGFPDHPHRGFITFTYMLEGTMLHRDSMGNEGILESGGAQWMKAGSGVIHSEMPQQENGLMRGFQLWVNLPASQKLTDPEYFDIKTSDIPQWDNEQVNIKILAGTYDNIQGPIIDQNTDILYLDISLNAKSSITIDTPKEHNAFIYCYQGTMAIEGCELEIHDFGKLSHQEKITITSSDTPCCAILVTGKPFNETIVQHGPFVMNTHDEIEKAITDFQNGTLVKISQ